MKSYICTKELYLNNCDEDGLRIENDYVVVEVGTIFRRSEEPYRFVGGKDSIRLESDTQWLEITEETLNMYFKEINEHPAEKEGEQ